MFRLAWRSARFLGLLPPPPPRERCSPADARAPCGFAVLPDELLLRVFAELPADARAVCARVCAAWREALVRGPEAWRCWTRLDLSGDSGVTCTLNDAALAGAAALAHGRLQELDLNERGEHGSRDGITLRALLRVLRRNLQLHTLALDGVDGQIHLEPAKLVKLIVATPDGLQRLQTDTVVVVRYRAEGLPVLRLLTPDGPFRMRFLAINFSHDAPDEGIGAVAGARRFASSVLARVWARQLSLNNTTWVEPAALAVLADALLARTSNVEDLYIVLGTSLSPAYLPALARLLAGRDGSALAKVTVLMCVSLFEGAAEADVELVCAALRRSTLTHVRLHEVGLTEQGAAALREAAAASPRLCLEFNEPP